MTTTPTTTRVRANLGALLDRIETVEHYARRNAPEIRARLAEARALARAHGRTGLRLLLLMILTYLSPAAAVAQALKMLDVDTETDPTEAA